MSDRKCPSNRAAISETDAADVTTRTFGSDRLITSLQYRILAA